MSFLKIFDKDYSPLKKNQFLNLTLALLYLAQAVGLVFVLGADIVKRIDITFLSQNYLTNNYQETFKHLFDLPLLYPLLLILTIAGLFHLVCGLNVNYSRRVLERGYHLWRWIIFGGLIALIAALTALLLGSSDLAYLLLIIMSLKLFASISAVFEYLEAQESRQLKKLKLKDSFGPLKLAQIPYWWLKSLAFGICLLIGFNLIAAFIWGSSRLEMTHYFVYLNSLLLIMSCLLNVFFHRRRIDNWRRYHWFEGSMLISHFFFISCWVWLVASMPL